MPVCYGVQSFVMASRAPVFHACSVDLSWQTTVHACQRCPRAAMTPSAATAAIATQSNVEGTTSRFCPAGVHMGKCLPAQEVYTDVWGSVSSISSALSGGVVPRVSQKFPDLSKSPDVPFPPPSLIEPWALPDLPLPTTVHSKASFSPSVPIDVQSALPDDSTSTPSNATSLKQQKTTPLPKPPEDKELTPSPRAPGPAEEAISAAKTLVQTEVDEVSISRQETPSPSEKEDVVMVKPANENVSKVTEKTPTVIPAEKVERTNGSPAVNSTAPGTTITPSPSLTLTKDAGKDTTTEETVLSKDETSTVPSSVSTVLPHFEDDKSKESVLKERKGEEEKRTEMPEVAKKVLKQTPSGDATGPVLKPLQPSKRVPQFYIPIGSSLLSLTELGSAMDKVQACILEGLAASAPTQKNDDEAEETNTKNPETSTVTTVIVDEKKEQYTPPTMLTVESLIPFSRFNIVTKACGCPLYWKRALFKAAGGENDSTAVPVTAILSLWRRVLETCPDAASQFIYLLTKGKAQYLVPDDFWPIIQDVVDTHPSLTFLQAAPEFHARYVTTVVSRIFFCANTSWSGRISLGELRRSNFLDVLASLETEEDINLVTQYFSYEHFYVIYCKFWELDTNHDLIISKADLARHNNYAISERMIDRIFSGAVTRGTSFKEGTMTYSDFVWFLLAEEDKRHPRSIEYWFRCMDLDGDGVLSLYELEYFYSEQSARMEEMGIEPPTLEDCLCQCLDMVRPALSDKIRLSDLKRCNLCPVFFDTFFNLPKYLQHEQRDPFSNLQAIEEGLTDISDWDRYASDTYEMLIVSESGGGGTGGEDDNEEDEEDEDLDASSPVASAEAEPLAAPSSEKSITLGEVTSPSSKEVTEPSSSAFAQPIVTTAAESMKESA
ncbi:Serine/threonine-protein phosphatase 2A regulatory subunit B'' subunit alpha [Echinococcus granulosus]|nr:Serine/threonine-protein phosphatase 2A regulatory subunit B'' subunit alpha [Echinococcus granulosus]CDS16336.1 serine:threonine protein phosphatase 2A [Echinococcus granulosus]